MTSPLSSTRSPVRYCWCGGWFGPCANAGRADSRRHEATATRMRTRGMFSPPAPRPRVAAGDVSIRSLALGSIQSAGGRLSVRHGQASVCRFKALDATPAAAGPGTTGSVAHQEGGSQAGVSGLFGLVPAPTRARHSLDRDTAAEPPREVDLTSSDLVHTIPSRIGEHQWCLPADSGEISDEKKRKKLV